MWPIKYIKGARPGLKRLAQVISDSTQVTSDSTQVISDSIQVTSDSTQVTRNQNSKQVKGFDDGEVNKQYVTKIESLFLDIDVIAFKQFPLVGISFKFYIW
jgi:hypothetical protein